MAGLAQQSLVSAELPISARRGAQLLLLTLAATAAVYASSALGPLQETMRIALSLTDNQMALLQGPVAAMPTVIFAIPLGVIIDRYSRVRLLLICALFDILGSILTALASSLAVLFVARCLVGLSVATTLIAIYSLLADHYVPAQRGRAKAVVVMGQYLGKSAAFALGGVLLATFSTGTDGWRWAMFWLSVPVMLITLSLLTMREPARTGVVVKNPSTRKSFRELWQYRSVIAPLLVGVVMVDFPIRAVMTWAAPTLSRNFGLPPNRVGAIMATVLIVSGVLGPIVGGLVADFCQRAGRPRRSMLVLSGLALLSVPGSLFAVAAGVESASALLVILITTMSATVAMGLTLFTIVVPNELRGLCLSLLTVVGLVFAGAIAPLAVSLLSGVLGGVTMIGTALTLSCVAANFLSAAAFAVGSRYVPRKAVQ